MKAEGVAEGVIAVWDQQTNLPVIRPAGEPDENQELFIVENGEWRPLREVTRIEQIKLQAIAFLEAAIEEIEKI